MAWFLRACSCLGHFANIEQGLKVRGQELRLGGSLYSSRQRDAEYGTILIENFTGPHKGER